MAYCTQTDVEFAAGGVTRFKELTDFDGDGSVDAAVVAALIDEAARWMDSYIAKRHAVPLETVPSTVKVACAREVVYRFKESRDTLSELDQDNHTERVEWLTAIAGGSITLGVDPLPTKSALVGVETGDASDRTDDDVGTFVRDDWGW